MNIIVSRHVFGSIRGYTTLAKSSDLSPKEISKLEILSFGQTNESSYLDSLQTNPAYISRSLYSEKWAVTRVFKGKSDVHNRTTLLFISAIVSIHDWLYLLKCDVNKLLYNSNLWQWNGEEKLKPIEISVESKKEIPCMEIRNKVLSLLGAVEKYISDEDTTIVVKESEFNGQVLRCLNMVLPVESKQTFSCTARSLNDGLPFSLISMAKEGSFGNSKRKIVNWTQDSVIENCPYTQSLSEFWQQGKLLPYQFIDSCKSFLIDFGGEHEPKPQKRRLTSKPLSDEIANERIGQKKYLSRKLAVLLFTCALIAGIATVITVGAMRVKAKKVKTSFIEGMIREAKVFLAQNSSREYFPSDKTFINQIIQQSKDLKFQLEGLLDGTNDPELKNQLKTVCINLGNLQNLANDLQQRYNLLDSRFKQVELLRLKSLNVYPHQERIEMVKELEKSISNVNKANLLPNYVSEAEKKISQIFEWRNEIGRLLIGIQSKVTRFVQSGPPRTSPVKYSEKQYKEYDDFKLKLGKFKEDESLKNAEDSPIKKHLKISRGVIAELDRALSDCNEVLKKLDDLKENSEKFFNDANDILSDLNITNGKVENFHQLVKASDLLDKAKELWPDKPNLEEKNKKAKDGFKTNKVEACRIWEENIQRIKKDADPNAAPIKELLEQYDIVISELEHSKIEDPDIYDTLQRIIEFDIKLRNQSSSISELKKKESKQRK